MTDLLVAIKWHDRLQFQILRDQPGHWRKASYAQGVIDSAELLAGETETLALAEVRRRARLMATLSLAQLIERWRMDREFGEA